MPETAALENLSASELVQRAVALQTERDEYKRLYMSMLEAYRKLEAGLYAQKRERFAQHPEGQLTLSVLASLFQGAKEVPGAAKQQVEAHERQRPTGRKPLPDNLPRVEVELLPPEVQKLGLDAFQRIGEDVTETVERRPASFVVLRTVRPKFVAKETTRLPKEAKSQGPVFQGEALELPIARAIAGPGLLADTIVHRFQNHLPLYRLERLYGREGLPLARSTVCGWHFEVASLCKPLVSAMWKDARESPYLCMDATGVLVQDADKCRRGHFFVVVAPDKHVLFGYTPRHDGKAVDKLLDDYEGFLVVDAHAVYNHLFEDGKVVEVACWSHSRRYFFKSLETDSVRARHALSLIQALFRLERAWASVTPEERLRRRKADAKPVVDAFFAWCDEESLKVLDETPISKGITYVRNQRVALQQFLSDGRLPIHNNHSENALRREALGRKNWLFLGTDEGGEVNATLVSLLASCQLHGLEPLGYLRDLLCILPQWPAKEVLQLAPAYWAETYKRPEVQAALAGNVFRQAAMGVSK